MNSKLKRTAIILTATSMIILVGGVLAVWISLERSFWTTSRSIKLNLKDTEQVALVAIDEQAIYPNSMELKMTGSINGQGIVRFGWSDTSFYLSDTLNGNFNIHYERLDWYNDTCYFKYEPITATKGELNIDCKIFSSRK